MLLTKVRIVNPVDGSITYVDEKDAASAIAAASARTAAPSTTGIQENYIPDPGATAPSPTFITHQPVDSAVQTSQPKFLTAPTEALTSKGTVLKNLLHYGLETALGGAAGAGARTGGEGAARALEMQQRRAQLGEHADLAAQQTQAANDEHQLRQAQLGNIPLQQQTARAQLANVQAEASRRGKFLVPGVGLTDEDGKVLVPEPPKQKNDGVLSTPEERRNFIDTSDPNGHVLSGRDRLGYIATGTWSKEAADKGPSLVGWIEDSNNPDPNISGPATKNLSTYRNTMHPQHSGVPGDGMSAAQQRTLRNDAQWSGMNKRYAALVSTYGKLSLSGDPADVAPISAQMDALSAQMDSRSSELLQKKSGGLKLKGSKSANPSSQSSLVGSTKYLNGRKVRIDSVDASGNAQVTPLE